MSIATPVDVTRPTSFSFTPIARIIGAVAEPSLVSVLAIAARSVPGTTMENDHVGK